jgi:murein tripeptide amidase MpaA
VHVSSAFDSGNVEVLDASDPACVRLRIRPDAGGDHFQWFHFRVTGAKGTPLTLHLENAAEASYPDGWPGYRACFSEDRRRWGRADTSYDGARLTIRHTPATSSVYFAYFAPYGLERHADLVARAVSSGAEYERLGATVDGRDLDLLRFGPRGGRRNLWIIARQHPGETMAEWLVEGLLDRLLDPADPVARELRAASTLWIVPNMNPDGVARGHLRNNAAGANLNRAWDAPSLERSPEVLAVRARMEDAGVDFFLDVHGDEAIPYNFIAGAEGTPSWDARKAERQGHFVRALLAASPDFQTEHGYPVSGPGAAKLDRATNWVAERFGCLALTLEQPFKAPGHAPGPDGWSPARARRLGRDVLGALWASGSAADERAPGSG